LVAFNISLFLDVIETTIAVNAPIAMLFHRPMLQGLDASVVVTLKVRLIYFRARAKLSDF
jgi:hypothetical protein